MKTPDICAGKRTRAFPVPSFTTAVHGRPGESFLLPQMRFGKPVRSYVPVRYTNGALHPLVGEIARADLDLVAVGGYAAANVGLRDDSGKPREVGDIDFVINWNYATMARVAAIMGAAGAKFRPLVEVNGYFEPKFEPTALEQRVSISNFVHKPPHMRLLTQYELDGEIFDFFSCGGDDPIRFPFARLEQRSEVVPYGESLDDGCFRIACLEDQIDMAARLLDTGPRKNKPKNTTRLEGLTKLESELEAQGTLSTVRQLAACEQMSVLSRLLDGIGERRVPAVEFSVNATPKRSLEMVLA
jgi:hypothetical protein